MSSEGDSPSAPPFDTLDGHPADGTIVPMGEEPKYRSGKGKVLPLSLAYHPSTSLGSDNTESGSFEVEDEATALARFSLERDEDEVSDDNMVIFWPQTNITAMNTIENVISDQKLGPKFTRKSPRMNRVQYKKYSKILVYNKFQQGGLFDTTFFTSGPMLARMCLSELDFDMGPTQEEAVEVRVATRRRIEDLRERAEKGFDLQGKKGRRRRVEERPKGQNLARPPRKTQLKYPPFLGLRKSPR
ncbi:hypothetical protein O6P43_001612 [Quillaja saponaria]|uniref:Uncharacterized protein n=1 Tax=Quillaja saponaria TaxID=32244 RepID=A0AAD7VNM8_QUISA|nr:hypothetical protein O6P43_001612 [Quillaja saponaria]